MLVDFCWLLATGYNLKQEDRDFFLRAGGIIMGKEMATHSSVLAWRIPGTGEPGGLPFLGLRRVRHNWSDLAAANYPCVLNLDNLEECKRGLFSGIML